MPKLPEAPDRKRGDPCTKKEPSTQKKEACYLSAVTSGETTHRKAPYVRLKTTRRLTFSLVAAVPFTNDPRLKTPNNGIITITIKAPYNEHLQLKRPDLDISTKGV